MVRHSFLLRVRITNREVEMTFTYQDRVAQLNVRGLWLRAHSTAPTLIVSLLVVNILNQSI